MALKLNGKPFELNPPTPTVSRVLDFLNKQSAEDLFTNEELARRTGSGSTKSAGFAKSPALNGYSLRTGRMRYWGNPRAVRALKQRLEAGQ